jgi:hypothetical protein
MNPYMNWINFYSNMYGVDPELYKRVIHRESKFDPKAQSGAGAYGLAQLMQGTAKDMGVDRYNPEQNLKGGAKYLALQQKKYGPVMGLAAYNWGPGNVDQYLAGKKEMPQETSNYLAALGPYADKTYMNAPMDPQGRPTQPTVLPTAAPPTQSIPQPSTGAPQMDEYESMKIFNPYVQMALGILAGNSGVNKNDAFANSMRGGLGAVNAAQRTGAYEQQVRAQTRGARREEEEYNLMKQRSQYMMDFAKRKLEDPNLDPDQRMMWEMAAQGSLKEGVQLFNTIGDNRNASTLNDIKLKMLENKVEKSSEKNARYELPLPNEHPFLGYSTDEKGELYDKKGIKLTGGTRDYVSQMLEREPQDIISPTAWKNKNDPTQIIPIKEYGRWINNKGENLNNVYQNTEENLTQSDIRNKGFRFVSEKQAENMAGVQSAVQQIKHLEDMLVGPDGVYTKNPIPDLKEKPLEAFGSMADRFTAGLGFGTAPWL